MLTLDGFVYTKLDTILYCSLGVHTDCTLLPPMYQNVLVNETFIKLLDLVCQTRPELDVIYGEVEGCIAKIPEQHPNPIN